MFNLSLEEQLEKNEKRIQELELQNESISKESKAFLASLKLTQEQLEKFNSNPDNFSPQCWEEMQKLKEQLDAKLTLDLNNIKNPSKTKKSYEKNKAIGSTWIFVR